MSILGYADALSAAPGDKVGFKISSRRPDCSASLVRYGGAPTAQAQAPKEPVAVPGLGPFRGREQHTHLGSHAELPLPPGWSESGALAFQLWIMPTAPGRDAPQTILSIGETVKAVLEAGTVVLTDGGALCRSAPLLPASWYLVCGAIGEGGLALHVERVGPLVPPGRVSGGRAAGAAGGMPEANMLRLAADGAAADHFNGKIEALRLFNRSLEAGDIAELRDGADPAKLDGCIAAWDFSLGMEGRHLHDRGPHGLEGRVLNAPARAVTGRNWTGYDQAARAAPHQYGAIHFHHDDLADAGWETDLTLDVPADLPSGIYGLAVTNGDGSDEIPLIVRAAPSRRADVLFLAPTHTYLAYANEHMAGSETIDWMEVRPDVPELNSYDAEIFRDASLGLSAYDMHADGSGVLYSSRLRPILNFRADYRAWVVGGPRHFAADLQTLGYLRARGFDHSVASDEDLDRDGSALLARHRVVVTGTHPEYWTRAMMTALTGFLASGGRLLYLGGNGFYWVTATTPTGIEVRRGMVGTRVANSAPGETYLSTTGEAGGLWRHCGFPPQAVAGLGMTGQGWGPGVGFQRLPASYEGPGAAFFKGIDEDVIGDFGHVMGGAVGDEIDRMDFALGTPRSALLLATSQPLDGYYLLTHEELLATTLKVDAPRNPLVRADMVTYDLDGGGRVFAAGSISFAGALAWNGYSNNVARLIDNVMAEFLRPG